MSRAARGSKLWEANPFADKWGVKRRRRKDSPPTVRSCIAAWFVILALMSSAQAQFTLPAKFNLSDDVRLDEADGNVTAQLRRALPLAAAGQHEEALDILRRAAESDGRKVVRVAPQRAVSVQEYGQMVLASLPAEALALYRGRVDGQAEAWYQAGRKRRDESQLTQLVDELFCSSRGDDALLLLGELALERGDPDAAAAWWLKLFDVPPGVIAAADFERIRRSPQLAKPAAALLDRFYTRQAGPRAADGAAWYVGVREAWNAMTDAESAELAATWRQQGLPPTRLAYPGTDIPRADVRARLILAGIHSAVVGGPGDVAGRLARVREELARFRALHPQARGHIAGQEQGYADYLAKVLEEAPQWPAPSGAADIATFAGDETRQPRLPRDYAPPKELGPPRWRVDLGKPYVGVAQRERSRNGRPEREPRIGESWLAPQSHFVVTQGELLFAATAQDVVAWNMRTGEPAWPSAGAPRPGVIYRDAAVKPWQGRYPSLDVPRFTLTVREGLLAARFGAPETSLPADDGGPRTSARSRLVLLDVGARGQGRLARLPLEVDDDTWAFDGVPLLDGERMYVALRRSDVRPQVHVACYDLAHDPPRLKWRTFVASAERPGSGALVEFTHNLLTQHGRTLYLNTQLGAVAALDAERGGVRWLHLYPRARLGDLNTPRSTPHILRSVTPCLYHRGELFVAPADAPAVMCLDADTGESRWSTDAAADAMQLLGVAQDCLVLGGRHLLALDRSTGRLLARWPEQVHPEQPGRGRGFLTQGQVWWPAQGEIHIFSLTAARQAGSSKPGTPKPGMWKPVASLTVPKPTLAAGNLALAADHLILQNVTEQQVELVAWRLE